MTLPAPDQASLPPDHFIITRFNLPLFSTSAGLSDSWLRHRVDLFETLCRPSLAAQTSRAFRWLVLLDSRSPSWLCRRMQELGDDGLFEPVYLAEALSGAVLGDVVRARSDAPVVITTRIDSDDLVAPEFVQTIRAEFARTDADFLNLVNGAQWCDGRAYSRPYTKNPFISRIERSRSELSTVYVDEHFRLDRHGRVRNVRTERPMWLQVVHGDNVANSVVGLRMRVRQLVPLYPQVQFRTGTPVAFAFDFARCAVRIGWRLVRRPSRLRQLSLAAGARLLNGRQGAHG